VDRGDERPDARIDHAGRQKELERVGGYPERVEEEWDCRIQAAEEVSNPLSELTV
jgi:hypothetical protein